MNKADGFKRIIKYAIILAADTYMSKQRSNPGLKVALIHDWLTGMRGGEKVLAEIVKIFPQASLFTLLHIPGSATEDIERLEIHESFISRLPFAKSRYRNYLPLFPAAVESFDLRDYSLIISSSHCVAKGALPSAGAKHLCYIHTPMRYAYDMFHEYFPSETTGWMKRFIIYKEMAKLRTWDQASNNRVDAFAANSGFVAQRVKRYYGREAQIVHPPVDTEFYQPGDGGKSDFHLIVSALEPYKRIDIAIEAFKKSGRLLKIIGDGSQYKHLKKSAGRNIAFEGKIPDSDVREMYRKARGFIFPGVEDFGITLVEAQACGTPVIAFRAGGALETVIEDKTGIFFQEQTPEALDNAIDKADKMTFNEKEMRRNSLKFSKDAFRKNFISFLKKNGVSI
jgi:glycosyltransferase involved in cell wall biosynthesis